MKSSNTTTHIPSGYFVSGIGTEVGKTVASAVLVKALAAHYWKPVQAGDLHHTDTDKVSQWAAHPDFHAYPEGYRLNTPASPHAAAAIDGLEIQLSDFHLPQSPRTLIVEGAGGLMVPLNDRDCIIDLMVQLQLPVILVSRNYLGSINHSLLSIEALRVRQLNIAGVLFNGPEVKTTQEVIAKQTGIKVLGRIEELETVSAASVARAAAALRETLYTEFVQ
ncbi:MAG: dethiobiotin synthase [Bacteroidota bacterium]